MRQLRGTLAALVLWAALAGCKDKPPATLSEQVFALPGGLRVDLVAGACGDGADVVVLYEVGSDHDPQGRSGLVHVLANAAGLEHGARHMLAARTVGGDGLTAALEQAAAFMTRPVLAAADVERARAAALVELANRRGGDATMTAMSFAAESVRPSPGGGWRGGIAAELEALTSAEVEQFARAYLTPVNARVMVVGRFDPARVRAEIERVFAPVPPGTPAVARAPVDATVTGTLVMGSAPAVVSLAVPAPPPSSPLYPGFLVLAARDAGSELTIAYDPLLDPDLLFVNGAVRPDERPEAAASRMRTALTAVLTRPLTRSDIAAAHRRYAAFLGARRLDPATCRKDRRGLAVGSIRRAQLGVDGAVLAAALDASTPAQLAAAVALFDPARTAAVIGGGEIR
jgi:zinc protease